MDGDTEICFGILFFGTVAFIAALILQAVL